MYLAGLILENWITLKAHAIHHKNNMLQKFIVLQICTEPHWLDGKKNK